MFGIADGGGGALVGVSFVEGRLPEEENVIDDARGHLGCTHRRRGRDPLLDPERRSIQFS